MFCASAFCSLSTDDNPGIRIRLSLSAHIPLDIRGDFGDATSDDALDEVTTIFLLSSLGAMIDFGREAEKNAPISRPNMLPVVSLLTAMIHSSFYSI